MHLLRSTRRSAGFTLMEMMVAILIIAILLAVAIPNWMKARSNARTRSCISNLRHIETAKNQYATESALSDGDAVAMADIVPKFIRHTPSCPGGGDYIPAAIGTDASCPNADDGHVLD